MATPAILFPWRDAYGVGIVQIDNQHKQLISLINKLHTAMLAGNGSSVLAGILDELVRYTDSHFAYEESLLRQRNYSGLAAHSQEHRLLTGQVQQTRDEFRSGKLAVSVSLMLFLKDWLSNHILDRDLAYARELKTR
jgi:hemerythrin